MGSLSRYGDKAELPVILDETREYLALCQIVRKQLKNGNSSIINIKRNILYIVLHPGFNVCRTHCTGLPGDLSTVFKHYHGWNTANIQTPGYGLLIFSV